MEEIIRHYDVISGRNHDQVRGVAVSDLVAHFNAMADLPETELAKRRADCAIVGHVACGEWYATNPPIHVCWHCLMRYRLGQDFGWVE
jgi:hypothetical protein